ncbi:MAG: polyprenyl synthetase family protein [Candidatus Cloacimonetes bacterium]|nr:polyprenyl synthetase family protein [Candidatus Cloacimonadota bacterium]
MDSRVLLKRDIKEKQELVNIILDRFLPRKDEYPKDIHKAIRYSVFAGGKRLRPYLSMLAYQLFKKDVEPVIPVAGAIEMIHTFTLIHDDLPDIDDDDYRRGKESCHKVFGEGIALLAGDALLISAFELITYANLEPEIKVQMIRELAQGIGVNGLISGQMLDIESEGKKGSQKTLSIIHENKTARLIRLSLRFGALAAHATDLELKIIDDYGSKIGLAFQIIDDLLDIEGNAEELGKTVGKDEDQQKVTYPALYGIEESHRQAETLIDQAKQSIHKFGERALLFEALADYLLQRKS